MAKSDRAKELEAKQKAEIKAAKLAKRNSDNPKDWGWFKQVTETYKITDKTDPQAKWYVLGSAGGVLLVFVILGIVLQPWWMWLITGVMAALVAALWVLLNRAKKATFTRYEGQPGAAEVALSMLDKKKWDYSAAITATRQLDIVHRAVGPSGSGHL